MTIKPVCFLLVILAVTVGFPTSLSRAADQPTTQPPRSTQTVETPPLPVRSSPAVRPAAGLRPTAVSPAPGPRVPLSQVNLSHLVVQYAGDAPDSTFVVELQRQSDRTGWPEAVLANHLAIQAMEGMNEDKRHWLAKLREMNALGEAISDHLRDLNDLIGEAINTGEGHGRGSKDERTIGQKQETDHEAWDAYQRCLETPREQRLWPQFDCIPPDSNRGGGWFGGSVSASASRVYRSLDNLDASLSKLDLKSLKPEDREFYESVKTGSWYFRKLVQRQERLSHRFPYKPPSRPALQPAPATVPRQLPAVRTAPVREMKKAPVAPQPVQPVQPVTPMVPMAPDTKKSKEAR